MNKETRYYATALSLIAREDSEIAEAILQEFEDQRTNLKLIASENYTSIPVQAAMGNLLTDKYSEGIPGARFYAGCRNIDTIESLAQRRAEKLFGADYACVQPHCGSDANLLAYWMVLSKRCLAPSLEEIAQRTGKKVKSLQELELSDWEKVRQLCHNQKLLAMDYYSGSHLTHGYRANVSGQLFEVHTYSVGEDGRIDYEALEKKVQEVKPLILLAGYSAFSRGINFRLLSDFAERNNATLVVDCAHFAGLLSAKAPSFTGDFDPVPFASIVTSTTHKTLRGPRGGLLLCKEEYRPYAEKACPMVMGGQLPHVVAAKAVAFGEALREDFSEYGKQVVRNSQALADVFLELGVPVISGGTDNHMVILDVWKGYGLTGRQAEGILSECGLCVNRQAIVDDMNGVWYTSGIRIGSAAVSSLGMKEKELAEIGRLINYVLSHTVGVGLSKWEVEDGVVEKARKEVRELLGRKEFRLYRKVNLKKVRRAVEREKRRFLRRGR